MNLLWLEVQYGEVDYKLQEYSTQVTFRQTWMDDRLAYEHVLRFPPNTTLPKFVVLPQTDTWRPQTTQQIWMPDTYFVNEKQARKHDMDRPNVLIRIHRDGSILFSVR